MMDCQPIREYFCALLEGELDAAAQAAVLEHLRLCPECRACLEECKPAGELLRQGLPESMPEPASSRLEQRLALQLHTRPAPAWQRFLPGRTGLFPAWALAALLLLAGSGLWLHFQSGSVTLRGWLVDAHCAPKLIAQGISGAVHTRACALRAECRQAGYGVLSKGQFVRFDAHGNAIALNALLHTRAKDHLRIVVSGRRRNHVLHVARLKLMAQPAEGDTAGTDSGATSAAAAAR